MLFHESGSHVMVRFDNNYVHKCSFLIFADAPEDEKIIFSKTLWFVYAHIFNGHDKKN